jgi:DNA-binding transcriptional LysR family regulator
MSTLHLERLDLNLLLALHWLLEERSVTRAARRLGLSPSATSHALGRLRELLGDPLLTPVARAMVPSARASELRPRLAAAIEHLRQALAPRADFTPAQASGRFRVACTDHVGIALASAWERSVRPLAPRLDLTLAPLAAETVTALTLGTVDLAVLPDNVAAALAGTVDSARFVRRPLFEERFVSVVRTAHRWAGRRPSMRAFAGLEHVLVSPQGSGPGVVDELLALEGLERRIAYRVPSFAMALPIVAATDCVATVPERLVRHHVFPLAELRAPFTVPRYVLSSFWHPTRTHDPMHRWLRQLLVASLA